MNTTLDIIEQQLNLGDVKIITCDGGKSIRYIELLFSPTTKVKFAPSEDKKTLTLSVSDNNLNFPELDCRLNKQTLRDYIVSLKNVYNELIDDNYET